MKIMLTGASGFVGKYCLDILGETCRVVRRSSSKKVHDDDVVIDNFDSQTDWSEAFENVNTIIHLAATAHNRKIDDIEEINTLGTIHLAKQAALAGVKRFVYVSSIGAHGNSTTNRQAFKHDDELIPHDPYSKSKFFAEVGLKKVVDESGIELVVVRPTLVYGGGAPGNFTQLVKLVRLSPFLPFGLIHNSRDFIAVQNLADLLVCCATHPQAAGHTFLASDCQSVSIKDFTCAIGDALGKLVIQIPISVKCFMFAGKLLGKQKMVDQLVGDLKVDSSNIRDVLGWEPPFTMKQAMQLLKEKER